jgi:hypothetical protein
MPRSAKGARLWPEPEERDTDGKLIRRASWVIRDGKNKIRTGCARTTARGLSKPSPNTLPASTRSLATADVILLKS